MIHRLFLRAERRAAPKPARAPAGGRPACPVAGGRHQRGVTMLVVLVLMSVMLLGGLALARMTEIGTLATGNSSFREASLQASEVGINSAYARVKTLTDEETNTGNWYWATIQTADTAGIPTTVDWANTPFDTVGPYTVRYAVERMCSTTPVTATLRQCLVKQIPQTNSGRFGQEELDPPNSRQFRITVRVTGPKDTETWVQSLVTKG
jgi:Tfp pilus assembly protein PilX